MASNMDTIGTMPMAEVLAPKMMTCLHKYYSAADLSGFFSNDTHRENVFFTLGIRDEEFEKLRIVEQNVDLRFVCVDAANGYTKYFVDRVRRIREAFTDVTIMAGNVATPEMVQELIISGAADIVKIGIGSGSACTTRMKTAIGYPQLSAIIECADAAHGLRAHVCADGGCRSPGDVVKAFAAGRGFRHARRDARWSRRMWRCMDRREWLPGRHEVLWYVKPDRHGTSMLAAEKITVLVKARRLSLNTKAQWRIRFKKSQAGCESACAYVGAAQLKDLSKCTTFVPLRQNIGGSEGHSQGCFPIHCRTADRRLGQCTADTPKT